MFLSLSHLLMAVPACFCMASLSSLSASITDAIIASMLCSNQKWRCQQMQACYACERAW